MVKTLVVENVKKIGDKIAQARHASNMTQSQLAAQLHTSQSAIARIEKGAQNVTSSMILQIGKALGKDIITISDNALNFRIHGGRPLHGEITVKTSKNAAVSALCASLLNHGTTILKNMPRIEEVNRMVEVLESIGVAIRRKGSDIVITPPKAFQLENIDVSAAMRVRSVVMLFGPLIHELEIFAIPQPGGCKLGQRTLRPHLYALENFGVEIEALHETYEVVAKDLRPASFALYEMSETATENAIMAAARLDGISEIRMASSNYMVQDLCFLLDKMGVVIEGVGTSTLRIHGVPHIEKDITYNIAEDPIEVMLFLSIAATTNSEITIRRCPIAFIELELLKLQKMGFNYEITDRYIALNHHTQLVDIVTKKSKLVAPGDKLHSLPFPGINMDNLPFFVPITTQALGQTLIHDWSYENRALYYMELTKLGAEMILADPHRIYVTGPTKLRPAEVVCPPALRPAALVLIAMLAAPGVSVLRNVYSINRGYEDLYARLNTLGARIEVLREFSA